MESALDFLDIGLLYIIDDILYGFLLDKSFIYTLSTLSLFFRTFCVLLTADEFPV